jgi:hypothetical protein
MTMRLAPEVFNIGKSGPQCARPHTPADVETMICYRPMWFHDFAIDRTVRIVPLAMMPVPS